MHRLMTKEEKQDLRIYMNALADNGQVKREGIEAYLKNDLIVPQCSECKNDIKDWMGDDKAIQLGDDDYICTTCKVLETRQAFQKADQDYGDSLLPEERKKIEETLAEDKEVSTEAGKKAKEIVETTPQTPEIVSIFQSLNESLRESKEINRQLLSFLKPHIINVLESPRIDEPKFTRKEINGSKTIQSDDAK